MKQFAFLLIIYLVFKPTSCHYWKGPEHYGYNTGYDYHHHHQYEHHSGWGYFVVTVPALGRPYYQELQPGEVDKTYYPGGPLYPQIDKTYLPAAQPQQDGRPFNPIGQPAQPSGNQNPVLKDGDAEQVGETNGQGPMSEKLTDTKKEQVQDTELFRTLKSITISKPPLEPNQNPCNLPPIVRPDFSAPGRRISEAMCFDYVWQTKFRKENSSRDIDCTIYKLKQTGQSAVITGSNTSPGDFPHMGAIGWQAVQGTWIFKCGSTLISPRFVLTAAHCTKSARDTRLADTVPKIVRLGDKNIIDVTFKKIPPKDASIVEIIPHPSYSAPVTYFDVALMRLGEDVEFTRLIQPACLWSKFDTSDLGPSATITGWGEIESGSRKISPELQAAVLDFVDSRQCDELLTPNCNRYWCGIEQHQICAGILEGKVDACRGDSGGPLQVRIPLADVDQGNLHYVVGVTSFGFGCAFPNSPGVYTRVSSFIDWIEEKVWGR